MNERRCMTRCGHVPAADGPALRFARLLAVLAAMAAGFCPIGPVYGQAAAPATQTQPVTIPEMLDLARKAMEAGNYAEAVQYFESVLSADSANLEALLGAGEAYLRMNRLPQAFDRFNLARKIAPDDWRAQFGLGTVCLQQNYFKMAASLLEKAERLAPPDQRKDIYHNLALAYRGLYRRNDAIAAAKRALAADPQDWQGMQLLATLYSDAGQYDEAITQIRSGISTLQAALAKDPGNRDLLEQLGQFWSLMVDVLQRKVQANPDARTYLAMADAVEQIGLINLQLMYHQALARAERAVELAPDDPDALVAKARFLYLIGKTSDAREVLQKALKIKPDHAGARDLLGKIRSLKPAAGRAVGSE